MTPPDRVYTLAEHRARHQELHAALLELVHDYLVMRGQPPTVDPMNPMLRDPIRRLVDWSAEQSERPSSLPGTHTVVPAAEAAQQRYQEAIERYQRANPYAPVSHSVERRLQAQTAAPAVHEDVVDDPQELPGNGKEPEHLRVGDDVVWLRSRSTNLPQFPEGQPVAAVITEQTLSKTKIQATAPDGTVYITWVSPLRLRRVKKTD